jgi:hypothetical protein
MSEEGDGEEEMEHLAFNTKSKKYFAVGLINNQGTLVKTSQLPNFGNFSVVYQIHREGFSTPLATAVLSDPWNDNLYYFCTVLFKKSGRYTISFLVEGNKQAGSIPPLIFPIKVFASTVRCGIADAFSRLQAKHFIDNPQRQLTFNRRELLQLTHQFHEEFNAVKAILATVALALPLGSLQDSESSFVQNKPPESILEPTGWDSVIEIAWKDSLIQAKQPIELMECVLVLEFYLNRGWLVAPNSRLLTSLPSPHFAIRCVTLSSVALRIFCLDKALAYDKTQVVSRELRNVSHLKEKDNEDRFREGGESRSRRYLKRSKGSSEISSQKDTDNGDSHGRRRLRERRGTNNSLKSENEDFNSIDSDQNHKGKSDESENETDEDFSEPDQDESNDEVEVSTIQRHSWICTECGLENELRARSCATCGEKKPAVTESRKEREMRRSSRRSESLSRRMKKRKRANLDQDISSDSEIFSERVNSRENESDNDEEGNISSRRKMHLRKSHRAHKAASYTEVSSEDEEFDAAPLRNKGPKASVKKARVLSVDEEYELYIRNLPHRINSFSNRINQFQTTVANLIHGDADVRFLSILRKLLTDERSQAFWEPVDLNSVPMYRYIISIFSSTTRYFYN